MTKTFVKAGGYNGWSVNWNAKTSAFNSKKARQCYRIVGHTRSAVFRRSASSSRMDNCLTSGDTPPGKAGRGRRISQKLTVKAVKACPGPKVPIWLLNNRDD